MAEGFKNASPDDELFVTAAATFNDLDESRWFRNLVNLEMLPVLCLLPDDVPGVAPVGEAAREEEDDRGDRWCWEPFGEAGVMIIVGETVPPPEGELETERRWRLGEEKLDLALMGMSPWRSGDVPAWIGDSIVVEDPRYTYFKDIQISNDILKIFKFQTICIKLLYVQLTVAIILV